MLRIVPVLAVGAALALAAAARAATDVTALAAFATPEVAPDDVVSYTITLSGADLPRLRRAPEPDFTDFDVVGGPSQGSSTQISLVNGRMTSSSHVTFTWQLQPRKKGRLTVASFAFDLGGLTATVPAAQVEVSEDAAPPARPDPFARPGRARPDGFAPWDPLDGLFGDPRRRQAENSRPRGGDRLSVTARLSDADVWVGQETVLTHELEFDVPIQSYTPPDKVDFPGFSKVQVEVKAVPERVVDEATGKRYQRAPLARWVLTPLQPGDKELEARSYQLEVVTGTDAWGMVRTQPVRRSTKPLVVAVRPLPPGAPESFTGAVGSFRLAAALEATQVQQGDGTTLVVTISGSGSLQAVAAPAVRVPEGLKLFDAEVADTASTDPEGRARGTRTFRWPLLVAEAGRHEIPPIEWSFFDPGAGRYVTRRSDPLGLEAAPGTAPEVAGVAPSALAAPLDVKAEDIHHVRPEARPRRTALHSTALPSWFWPSLLVGPGACALAIASAVVRRVAASSPEARRRNGAARAAARRLATARSELLAGKASAAADAAAVAVARFVSDRLLLSDAQPSPEVVRAPLVDAAGEDVATRVATYLAECDFARFAGAAARQADVEQLVRQGETLLRELGGLRPARAGAA
jgi:hypothetical protein